MWEHRMKKWALGLGLAGALWMVFVLYSKSLPLARVSNYPGVFGARWVHLKGIAPSAETVLAFDIWLVVTNALEWIAVGLVARSTIRFLSRPVK
jgi:hypothetical protein